MLPENTEVINNISKKSNSSEQEVQCHLPTVSQRLSFSDNKLRYNQTENSANNTFNLNKFSNCSDVNVGENSNFTVITSSFVGSSSSVNDIDCEEDDNDNIINVNVTSDVGELNEACDTHRSRKKIVNVDKSNTDYPQFEFDGDYGKDLDSSGLFEFSVEGEKLVSSLCGPQKTKSSDPEEDDLLKEKTVNKLTFNKVEQDNYTETLHSANNLNSSNCSFISTHLETGMSFSNAVTSTPEKDDNSTCIHHLHNLSNNRTKSKDKIVHVTETESFINRHAGGDKIVTDNDSSEIKHHATSQSSTQLSAPVGSWLFSQNRASDKNELCSTVNETGRCNLVMNSKLCEDLSSRKTTLKSDDINKTNKSASVPDIFSMSNKFNRGDHFLITANNDVKMENADPKNEHLLDSSCDDEISFRKSAIKGCLVFERIIKDLSISTQDHDLENYCKSVKRCVSVANSIESREFTVLITGLIFSFLKLADSWGILNSYFGDSGNSEYKTQNLDDINLYRSFQDWQIKSRTLLDHLTIVVQNLKESAPKMEDKSQKFGKQTEPHICPPYNPLLSSLQSKATISSNKIANTNFPLMQPLQKEESVNYQMTPQFQTQDIQFPKTLANIVTTNNQNQNWKQNISETGQKKTTDIFWELPQNTNQSLFNFQQVNEKKQQRKKWTLPMPDFQSETPNPTMSTSGIPIQQPQAAGPIPTLNFQYLNKITQQNKGPGNNMLMQPFNFFGNQFNTVQNPLNIQNIRSNTAFNNNYCQQAAYFPNLKQSPKRKSNVNFKPEDQLFHKDVINNGSMFNRIGMCPSQQMNIPLLQNNMNPNQFSNMMDETKNNIIYQNFCIGDGKPPPTATNATPYAPFIHGDMYHHQPSAIPPQNNMFCHKTCEMNTMLPVTMPINNGDGDDSSEEYFPIKSYMKPGSYRVPNKSKSLVLQSTNNLNYIFDDVLVTGITVPFTKSNSFSQSKKNALKPVNTIEKSIQTSRTDEVKNSDSIWKAALASAQVLGQSLICKQDEKNQSEKSSTGSQEKGGKIKDILEDTNKTIGDNHNQTFTVSSNECSCKQVKDDDQEVCKKKKQSDTIRSGTIKTDDWLIQSVTNLEGHQNDTRNLQTENTTENCSASKSYDSKISNSNLKNVESDDSDNTTNDMDSECYSNREKCMPNQKKEKNNSVKQKLPPNLRSVSILQKPREYCQSRNKPWDKTRDFSSYQMPAYKGGDTRNLHKTPANWIKFNRKCISRQTLFKLQDILNSLSKMESSSSEAHKDASDSINKIINVNAVNNKLKSHNYENIDQILIDIRQMFVNGRENNKENSNIIELINKLETCFEELIDKHFGQSDSASDNRDNSTGASLKNRRAQKVQRKIN